MKERQSVGVGVRCRKGEACVRTIPAAETYSLLNEELELGDRGVRRSLEMELNDIFPALPSHTPVELKAIEAAGLEDTASKRKHHLIAVLSVHVMQHLRNRKRGTTRGGRERIQGRRRERKREREPLESEVALPLAQLEQQRRCIGRPSNPERLLQGQRRNPR